MLCVCICNLVLTIYQLCVL